ncbi:unnamed protein product [Arabidopsis lyrata]|nr:unnamed protein product [Arabidopsis lyrata]
MSSLLLSLSSRPSLRKLALRCHTLRVFSSSTTTNPYLMYSVTYCGEYPEAGAITKLRMFDPAKEDYFTVGDKPLSKELAKSRLVGSSHGWGVFISSRDSILISDYCNPSSSKSNPKMIPLPPRQHVDSCQTELVSGVAMSSSPEEEDFVAAVKFMGPLVGIYMPGQADEGTSAIYLLLNSVTWNKLLNSCYRTQQLVESPSGQRFLVKWYVQSLSRYVKSLMLRSVKFNFGGTKLFMVFREEEDMNMCYTEDIGDLCIFLGNNEPFCVKASSFPGLNPNSIYFLGEGYGEGYGVYDIATRTPRSFNPKSFSAFSDIADSPNGKVYVLPDWVPHWIPPSPL